jgi:hypothetical protein
MLHLNFKKKNTFLSTSFKKILSQNHFLSKIMTYLKITAEKKPIIEKKT